MSRSTDAVLNGLRLVFDCQMGLTICSGVQKLRICLLREFHRFLCKEHASPLRLENAFRALVRAKVHADAGLWCAAAVLVMRVILPRLQHVQAQGLVGAVGI